MGQHVLVVDAFTDRPFTDRPFSSNPAAVALLDGTVAGGCWPRDDSWMQAVAAEMNLSETAFVAPDPDTVTALAPDLVAPRAVEARATIVCAADPHGPHRVVSPVSAPGSAIDEDPVTGSAHCTSASWCCPRLGVDGFRARHASRRGGTVVVTLGDGSDAERVRVSGQVVTVAETTLR